MPPRATDPGYWRSYWSRHPASRTEPARHREDSTREKHTPNAPISYEHAGLVDGAYSSEHPSTNTMYACRTQTNLQACIVHARTSAREIRQAFGVNARFVVHWYAREQGAKRAWEESETRRGPGPFEQRRVVICSWSKELALWAIWAYGPTIRMCGRWRRPCFVGGPGHFWPPSFADVFVQSAKPLGVATT
jgi:hypothetical protein